MYNHHLIDMVNALIDNKLVDSEDLDTAVDVLRISCWTDKIAGCWGIEDVYGLDDSLDHEAAREVLELVLDNLDAEIGINWGTIEFYIDVYHTAKERESA